MSDLTLDQTKARISRLTRSARGENIQSRAIKMQRKCCADCRHYRPQTVNDAHAVCDSSKSEVSWFTPTCTKFRRA